MITLNQWEVKEDWSLEKRLEFHCIPEPTSGCWLWTAKCNKKGYGGLFFKGKSWQAHRAAWTVWKGPIPPGMQILHRCDMPCCINPDHLFLGTNEDNVADRVSKGRNAKYKGPFGERHPARILTAEQVIEIKKTTDSQSTRAAHYGVSRSLIGMIRQGKKRTHG